MGNFAYKNTLEATYKKGPQFIQGLHFRLVQSPKMNALILLTLGLGAVSAIPRGKQTQFLLRTCKLISSFVQILDLPISIERTMKSQKVGIFLQAGPWKISKEL